MLPAAIPNLLVNGATGIAVGMATNMAPHNLVEVVQALRHLITHPDATLDDLMRFVPGPDLPTGGMIVGLDGIRDAYETGRGTFRMRATARDRAGRRRRKGIVVTELPYGVGTEKVSERIKSLVQAKKLQGIADIKDLTDREHGLRLVIEVKNGFVPEALLEQLYRLTPMEDSFGINTVALVDGQPRTLGLKELLEVFLDHRFDVVRRRSAHRRTKAADRLHLVEGLLVAILDIDEVIQLIRSSDNAAEAKERLIGGLRPDRRPRPTTSSTCRCAGSPGSPRSSWRRRRTSSSAPSRRSTRSSADDQLLRKVVSDELAEVAKTFGTPRRTVLLESAGVTVSAAADLARGRRRPVLRLPLLVRAARPLVARPSSPSGEGARDQPRRDRLRGAHDAPAARSARSPRAAASYASTCSTCRPCPRSANHPNLQGGLPVRPGPLAPAGRAGAGAVRRCAPTGPASRWAPGRAW